MPFQSIYWRMLGLIDFFQWKIICLLIIRAVCNMFAINVTITSKSMLRSDKGIQFDMCCHVLFRAEQCNNFPFLFDGTFSSCDCITIKNLMSVKNNL